VRGFTLGLMRQSIKESGGMIRKMAMGCFCGLVELFSKALGLMGLKKGKASIKVLRGRFWTEFGRIIKLSSL
jgi:hypothetical protein